MTDSCGTSRAGSLRKPSSMVLVSRTFSTLRVPMGAGEVPLQAWRLGALELAEEADSCLLAGLNGVDTGG